MGGSPAVALCPLLKPAPCHCHPKTRTGVCLQIMITVSGIIILATRPKAWHAMQRRDIIDYIM